MKYRNLGAAGVKVSSLCLGAMTFGEADEKSFMHKVGSDEATAHAVLDRAIEQGINFVDTADVYGQDGLSERVLGAWLKQRAARATRSCSRPSSASRWARARTSSGASRYRIVQCCEDSLRRLGTDRIDLYQIHMQDITTPEEETLRALDDLVRAGKILYIGCSNYAAYRLMDIAVAVAKSDHLSTLRHAAGAVQPASCATSSASTCRCAATEGLGILPWSPLAGGFLTGKFERGKRPDGRHAPRREGADRALRQSSATGRSSTRSARSRRRSTRRRRRSASHGCSRSRR